MVNRVEEWKSFCPRDQKGDKPISLKREERSVKRRDVCARAITWGIGLINRVIKHIITVGLKINVNEELRKKISVG